MKDGVAEIIITGLIVLGVCICVFSIKSCVEDNHKTDIIIEKQRLDAGCKVIPPVCQTCSEKWSCEK